MRRGRTSPSGPATSTSRAITLDIARTEASGINDAQFVIDLQWFGTEIELWAGDPAAALGVALDGFDRLVEMDDAVLFGQLAMPAAQAAADLAVRARAARDQDGVDRAAAGRRGGRHRGLRRVDRTADRARRPCPPRDRLARMAVCMAELRRAEGEDDPAAWEAIRPALTARPAPFLEAYVLWRAAEAHAVRGGSAAAAGSLRAAEAIAARIGAHVLHARIEGLGRRLRVTMTWTDTAPQPAEAAAPADPFGLTLGANARSSRSWRRATRTGGSPRPCSSARARPASTSRTSPASSASGRGPRLRPSRSGSGSTWPPRTTRRSAPLRRARPGQPRDWLHPAAT